MPRNTVAMRLRVALILIPLLWIFSVVYILNTLNRDGMVSEHTDEQTDLNLVRAIEKINNLQREKDELNILVRTFRNTSYQPIKIAVDPTVQDDRTSSWTTNHVTELSPLRPSLDRELRRRELEDDISEYMMFIKARLRALRDTAGSGAGGGDAVNRTINKILADGFGYQKALERDFASLRDIETTGDNYSSNKGDNWRLTESLALGDLVQKRIAHVQNPANCSTANKLVCDLSKVCGYGCQLHHVTYCLLVAYATERTLVLKSRGWRYAAGGWETVFLPLSNTCTDGSGTSASDWKDPTFPQDKQVMYLPIIDQLHPVPEFLPLAVPDDLADRILLFHAAPAAWWIGQFVKYLTRPQQHLDRDIEDTALRLGFSTPIVGVHIRRTDKITGHEAVKHELSEYMEHVEDWFQIYESEHPGVVRQVYLATDQSSILEETRAQYPTYKFITDNEISKVAGKNRYTDVSLRGVIIDIHFLSRSDFLVCTFSSQVCRVAYEVMQTLHGDASRRYKSLDDSYYYGGMKKHLKIAIYDHVPESPNEIELRRDDVIAFAGNHWDGYSMGTNQRTGKRGLYPSYKVRDTVKRVKMPTYSDVDE